MVNSNLNNVIRLLNNLMGIEMSVKQTRNELLDQLKDHIHFLIASCNSYDNGFQSEAKRLAVSIRVLVHDTPKKGKFGGSQSLLTLLGNKNIQYYDSAYDYSPTNVIPEWGLICLCHTQKGSTRVAEYVPMYDHMGNINRKVPFGRWWNKTVFDDKNGAKFNRSQIVLAVANKDGGAHVDPELTQAYANLTRFNSLRIQTINNGIPEDISNPPELASVRQIAHELLKTLKDEFPQYFTEPIPIAPQKGLLVTGVEIRNSGKSY